MMLDSKHACDENLSDELLSEDATSSKVKISDKIIVNMERKSISWKKGEPERKNRNCSSKPKSNTSASFLTIFESKTNERERFSSDDRPHESLDFSILEDEKHNTNLLKSQRSLKKDISHLLRLAAAIRKEKENLNIKENIKMEHIPSSEDFSCCRTITMKDVSPYASWCHN
ncbi:unnamed protein product [Moneuplotes crassus]|uniref:Uncharacterized protein n=1 Tax=Euplotes crassus TaxID=5936 RepID=A0AAD1U4E7_EUPCR|nr:unnamed protein product [Moneuplotes crassus]